MAGDSSHTGDAFFSGPFDRDEVARLASAVDASLARHARATPAPAGGPHAPAAWSAVARARAALAVLEASSAPLFDASRGSPAARAVKRVLNLPLALLARPQRHFNAAARAALATCCDALDELARADAALRDALVVRDRRLAGPPEEREHAAPTRERGGARDREPSGGA
ncbi:MAG TPA: hypothetical protein VFD84_10305 [Candidatus Binatia bacterium]|nr:hypothetical protein [Candidatus Binatia bacterium]